MIHKTAVISGNVKIGKNVFIEPYAVIHGPAEINDNVYIGPHAVIGAPPQHRGSYPSPISAKHRAKGVIIKENACLREYTTVHQGIIEPTIINELVFLMAGCQINHDCFIGKNTTLASYSILGGFTIIDKNATFGQGVVTHPWIIIGESSMVGLNSSVIRDVKPFCKVAGSPARVIGSNTFQCSSLPKEYLEEKLPSETWENWSNMRTLQEKRKALWKKIIP